MRDGFLKLLRGTRVDGTAVDVLMDEAADEIETLTSKLDAAEKFSASLQANLDTMTRSRNESDQRLEDALLRLDLALNGSKMIYELADVKAERDALASRLQAGENLLIDAEGMLCDPQGGPAANECAERIRAFLARAVETRVQVDRPALEGVRCNNVPCCRREGHSGPCSSFNPEGE